MKISYDQYKILFIDDEQNILRALKRDLRNEPFVCFYTKDIYEALSILNDNDIAVVVSDLRMPQIDGLEFIKKVKMNFPSAVRIILTAMNDPDTILNAIKKGSIYRYLIKPWNTRGELIPAIYQAIDQFVLQKDKELRTQELILQNKALTQLNQQLNNAQNAIVELERKNTALAMGITTNHELNQPLMVLSANIELLQEILGPEKITEREKKIFNSIKEAFSKINSILKKYREASEVKFEKYLDGDRMLVFHGNKSDESTE